jgi:acyl-CoA thioester hydrolase
MALVSGYARSRALKVEPSRYTFPMPKLFHAEARLRVRYAETDQMGVVYHANYLIWFEVGRVELLRSLGIPYQRLEQDFDCLIAVVAAELRYRSPARYDDEIGVRTRLVLLRGPLMKIQYQVIRLQDDRLLCEGETTHVVVNRAMEKRRLPETYETVFRQLLCAEPDGAEDL